MIHLLNPESGAIHVDPQTEILLSFGDIPDQDWKSSVHVNINGDQAIQEGTLHPDYETTRCERSKNTGRWGVRSIDPLPQDDIFVQASCGKDRSHNQRFFVRGAHTTYSVTRPQSRIRGRCWHPAGWFWVHDQGWDTPHGTFDVDIYPSRLVAKVGQRWMVAYTKRGVIQYSTSNGIQEDSFRPIQEDAQIDCVYSEEGWHIIAVDQDGVHTYASNRETHWGFDADHVAISNNIIHARVGKLSFHIPLHYEPAIGEDTIESWYMMDQYLNDGSIQFYKDFCVVWNNEKMIARHDFDAILGESEDMLWTADDIGEHFQDVQIIDTSHVLVNESKYLHTRQPRIQTI